MTIIQNVRCPNCGSLAERFHFPLLAQVKTECQVCDYLMVVCSRTSKVIEAYAPGLSGESVGVASQSHKHSLGKLPEYTATVKPNVSNVAGFATQGNDSLSHFRSSGLRKLALYNMTTA